MSATPAPRGRLAPQQGQQTAAPAAPAHNPLLKRGQSVTQTAEVAAEEARHRQQLRESGAQNVQRFFMKAGEVKEIVILDASLDDGVGIWEHQYKGADGKWGNYEQCLKEVADCPICSKLGQPPYYAVYLSILDLTGYTSKTGTFVPQSRKLLRIKQAQLDTFKQLETSARAQGKSMRGMFLRMTRSTTDTKVSNIGEPTMMPELGGMSFYIYDEDQIVQEFGHDALVGRDGGIIKQANADIYPMPYELIFPFPDIGEVRRRWGVETLYDQAQRESAEQPAAAPARTAAPRTAAPAQAAPARTAPAPARAAPAAPATAAAAPRRAVPAATQAAPAAQEPVRPARPARPVAAPAAAPQSAEDLAPPDDDDPLGGEG